MAELKKKEFIKKCLEAKDIWVCAARSDKGVLIGWFIGFSSDDDQSVLITDKGVLRVFKTADSAIEFVSDNALTDSGMVSVAFA